MNLHNWIGITTFLNDFFVHKLMPILELKTAEATYRNDMARGCHFMIDCACGGTGGEYHGSHYKNDEGVLEEITRDYEPLSFSGHSKSRHTFFLSEQISLHELFYEHREERNEKPLVIVCNDCHREFPFTHGSYLDLRDGMMMEYNRRLKEKEEASVDPPAIKF